MSVRIDKNKLLSVIKDLIPAPPPAPAGAPIIFDYFIEIRYDPANDTYIVSIIDQQGNIRQHTVSYSELPQVVNSFIASVSGKRIYIVDYSNALFTISLGSDNIYVIENIYDVMVNHQCSVFAYNVDYISVNSPARVIKAVNSSTVHIINAEKIDDLLIDAVNVHIDGTHIELAGIRSGYLSIINSSFGEAYIYTNYVYIDNLLIKRDTAIFSDVIAGIKSITSESGAGSISGKMFGTVVIPAGSSSQIKILDTNLPYMNVNIIYSVREAGLAGKVSVSYDATNKIVTFTNSDATNQATVDYMIVIS